MTSHSGKHNHSQSKRIGSVKQLVDHYPGFTTGGVRNWLFHDTEEFRSDCAIKIGTKILIDFDSVDVWLERHRGNV